MKNDVIHGKNELTYMDLDFFSCFHPSHPSPNSISKNTNEKRFFAISDCSIIVRQVTHQIFANQMEDRYTN